MQQFLLDENLSRKLVDKIVSTFISVTHVSNEGLLSSFDGEIWAFAKNKNQVIITKDYDFSDMSHLYGCPPKVIKLNCGNKTTEHITAMLLSHHNVIKAFVESDNCYMEIL